VADSQEGLRSMKLVASVTTDRTEQFMLNILRLSMLIISCFYYFQAYFVITFLYEGIATSINMQILSSLFLIVVNNNKKKYYV
jgi:hypothetical protein